MSFPVYTNRKGMILAFLLRTGQILGLFHRNGMYSKRGTSENVYAGPNLTEGNPGDEVNKKKYYLNPLKENQQEA